MRKYKTDFVCLNDLYKSAELLIESNEHLHNAIGTTSRIIKEINHIGKDKK